MTDRRRVPGPAWGGRVLACLAGIAACAVMVGSALAREADEDLVSLEWKAPPGCPSGQDVSRRIEQFLEPSRGGVARRWKVGAVVSRAVDRSWRVDLVMSDGAVRAARELRAESCRALGDAAALVVALTIHPAAAEADGGDAGSEATVPPGPPNEDAASPSEEPRGELSPPAPQAPAIANIAPPPPGDPRPSSNEWRIALQGLVGGGDRPGASAGLGLVVGWASGRVALEGAGAAWLPTHETLSEVPSVGARFRLLHVDVRGCYGTPARARLRAAACLGVRVARLEAKGFGAPRVMGGVDTLVGPLAGAWFAWRVSESFAWRLDGELSTPVVGRRPFVVNGTNLLYRPSQVAWGLGLGFELDF